MKKIISLLLVCFIILLSLNSCKNPGIVSEDATVSETASMNLSSDIPLPSAFSEIETSSQVESSTQGDKEKETSETVAPTQKPVEPTKNEDEYIVCSLQIDCSTVLENRGNLNEAKLEFVPADGKILAEKQIRIKKGSTAFDLIKTACAENVCGDNCRFCVKDGIHLDYSYTPAYKNYYIRGIHQLYEKDCGSRSGWMYCVNGVFPNYGCSSYELKNGDAVKFIYTCDLGEDIS